MADPDSDIRLGYVRNAPTKLIKRCDSCPVYHRAVCTALSPELSPILSATMVERHFRKNDTIWNEGDDTDFFAIVVAGAVKLMKLSEDGRRQVVGIMFASDCIGNPYSDIRTSFAEAASDTELCCFPNRDFEHALQQDPLLKRSLLKKLFEDLTHSREWLLTVGRKHADERLASFLVLMLNRKHQLTCGSPAKSSIDNVIDVPISRGTIAEYLGLTLETVSRHYSKLAKAGVVETVDKHFIKIHNPRYLYKLAGEPIPDFTDKG